MSNMQDPVAAVLWDEMKRDPANRICVECGRPDPTWASVSYGNFFCLECSGVHRSLGVHISFVRSIGMDKWSPQQLDQMRVGGNKKCKQFFSKHGIPDSMSIKDKYHTEVADAYKAKIKAESEGRGYSEPAVGSLSTTPNIPQSKFMASRATESNNPGGPRKYEGMGSPLPQKSTSSASDDWSNFLSSVTSVASAAAATTTQYAKTAAERLAETSQGITEKVSQSVSDIQNNPSVGSTWGNFSSYFQSALNVVKSTAESLTSDSQQPREDGEEVVAKEQATVGPPQRQAKTSAPRQERAPISKPKKEKVEEPNHDDWLSWGNDDTNQQQDDEEDGDDWKYANKSISMKPTRVQQLSSNLQASPKTKASSWDNDFDFDDSAAGDASLTDDWDNTGKSDDEWESWINSK